MSLLSAIMKSEYLEVVEALDNKENVNATLNSNPPMTMLEVALEVNKENPSSLANSIIVLLKAKGAKTYEELLNQGPRVKKNLPPLSVKGKAKGNIKTHGIAGPSMGGIRSRHRRNKSRKTRRSNCK